MSEMPNIYFLGIGGIGMSALARYFLQAGKKIAGYDRTQTELCKKLESEGIKIHYEADIKNIPKKFKEKQSTLVIYTPALSKENPEILYFQNENFELKKRAEILGNISRNHQCLAVAGTHGKTTTSALLAHIFKIADQNPTAFLGGISTNYQTNFLKGEDGGFLIAEADEFDRSFLQLQPAGAIITSTDADHLDVYENAENLRFTFQQFGESVRGPLIANANTSLDCETYSIEKDADFRGENVRIENHLYHFDLKWNSGEMLDITCGLAGRHNVENAVAAAALSLKMGIEKAKIRQAIATFKGVKRRFEFHIQKENQIYIDDYAHHPEEIKAFIHSVKELFPNKKITGIFQPHLYSRTRDFMNGFAESLSLLDELILMNIYPAREKPIPNVHSHTLLEKVDLEKKSLLNGQEIFTKIQKEKPEVLLTMGAGDIDKIVNPLKMKLLQ